MLFSWTIPPSPSPTESIRVCLQSCPASPSFPMSQLLPSLNQMANVLEFQLQYQSFQWIFRAGIFWDWLVWSPCCPKDYQDSSSITVWKHQFLRVQPSLWSNSHIHTWLLEKSQLWLYGQLIAKWCLCFLIHCLGLSKFFFFFFPRSKYLLISWLQSPSTVILELKKIKSVTASIFSSSICHEVMGLDGMISGFFKCWVLS